MYLLNKLISTSRLNQRSNEISCSEKIRGKMRREVNLKNYVPIFRQENKKENLENYEES
jgi:hypothetical protein